MMRNAYNADGSRNGFFEPGFDTREEAEEEVEKIRDAKAAEGAATE
jgi:hypothetical protein